LAPPPTELTATQVVVEYMAAVLKQTQSKAQVAFQVYNDAHEMCEGNKDGLYGLPQEHELREGVEAQRDELYEAQFTARADVLVAGLELLEAIDQADLERDDPPRIVSPTAGDLAAVS